jgi:hypothetical protein
MCLSLTAGVQWVEPYRRRIATGLAGQVPIHIDPDGCVAYLDETSTTERPHDTDRDVPAISDRDVCQP